jgi:phage tail sheath gpL-like
MAISFSEALGGPVPATEIEINLQGAGGLPSGDQIRSVLVLAEKVAAGTATVDTVESTPFADADAAQTYFGAGSPGDCMCQQIFAYRNSDSGVPKAQVYGGNATEVGGSTAAVQTLTFGAGPATSSGVFIFKVGGHPFSVTVSTGDAVAAVATAAIAAYNALTWAEKPPITASSGGAGIVTFTANVKGAAINNVGLETVQDPDTAITDTWSGTTMGAAGGTPGAGAGPALTTLIAAMASFSGAGQIVTPWLESGNAAVKDWDATAVNALMAHVVSMGDATNMVPSSLILSYKGTAAEIASILTTEVDDGDDAERAHFAAAPYSAVSGSGSWEGEIAAQFAAMRASESHLARSMDGLKFVDLDPPLAGDNWTRTEQKTLIEAGGSPVHQPSAGAQMVMVRDVSCRTEFGVLDGEVMDVLDYTRAAVAAKLTSLGRASIVDDDESVPPVEHITQPAAIKALIRTVFDELADTGYLTNVADNWDNVIIELSGSTVQMSIPTDVIPQLHNKMIRLDSKV